MSESNMSRRNVARGVAWSVPAIVVGAPAPAIAASACAAYKPNQPLPASAFTTSYLLDSAETQGALANKLVRLDFGFRISDEATTCGVKTGAITSSATTGNSRFQLSNGKSYAATNGLALPANGTVGVVDTSCSSGRNGVQACGTTGPSAYNLTASTSTSSYHVTGISLAVSVAVAGYGTTLIYLNGSGFGTTAGSNDYATVLPAVTSSPIY